MGFEDLRPVFCDELIRQELDNDDREIPIPQEILDFYKMYRPSPLVRAYCLEKALGTPAKIYYKFEGNNTSGSHKLNSAIAQAYYAKQQGLKGVTTETGAGSTQSRPGPYSQGRRCGPRQDRPHGSGESAPFPPGGGDNPSSP